MEAEDRGYHDTIVVSGCSIGSHGVYSQSTEGKDAHQSQLLPPGQLERLEHGHWEDQDHKIGENVNGRVRKPQGFLIKTKPRH